MTLLMLVGSTIVIAYLRKPSPWYDAIFQQYSAAICGVTRAEVLHGAKDQADFGRYQQALNNFQKVLVAEAVWDRLGENLCHLRAAGVTVPFADALIAAIAIENELEL